MAKNFNALRDKMTPESRKRAQAKAETMLAEMVLSELRKAAGLTQTELADLMEMKQSTISQIESQSDIHVSTLRKLVSAVGGQLELRVKMASGKVVSITQFSETISEPETAHA